MEKPFRPRILLSALLALSLAACATPHYKTVDHFFPVNDVRKSALREIARDITRHSDGAVIIMVKYKLAEPYAGSYELARAQGRTVRTYLRQQGVKAEIKIVTAPAPLEINEAWISYQVRVNGKSPSRITRPVPAPAPAEIKPDPKTKAFPDMTST